MGGEQMKRTLDPHEQPAPDPSLTAEEFRAQFTEEMRKEITDGLELLWHHRFFEYKQRGLTPQDAGREAGADAEKGRAALRLLAGICPQPYSW